MCFTAMNNPIESAIPARIMNESGLLAASAAIAPKPVDRKQKRSVLDGLYMMYVFSATGGLEPPPTLDH